MIFGSVAAVAGMEFATPLTGAEVGAEAGAGCGLEVGAGRASCWLGRAGAGLAAIEGAGDGTPPFDRRGWV